MHEDKKLILTIDLGTSGPKVSVFDHHAQLVDYAFEEVPLLLLDHEGAEQRPSDWIAAIRKAYQTIRQRNHFNPAHIVGLNVTTQWSGTVPLDEQGNCLMNAIIWMDARGAEFAAKLTDGLVKVDGYAVMKMLKWIRITGGGPTKSGKDSIAHILFVQHKLKDIYERTYKFLEPKDYLNYWLTGKMAASYDSITLHWITDNRNVNKIEYSDELIRMTGVDRKKLPDLIPTNSILGTITPAIAKEFELREDVQVISGTPDTHSAAVGSGAVKDGEPHLYIGTSSWLIAHIREKKTDLIHNMASIPSGIPGRYMIINEQETTGACLNFMRNQVFFPKDDLNPKHEVPTDFYEVVDKMVAEVPAGSHGLIFLPWLNGERSPVDDHHARGGFYNLSLSNTRGDMLRAVFEGVAMNNRWLLDYAEKLSGHPFEAVNFIGGGARSDIWSQILADIFNRPIRQMKEPLTANSRGAALLGLVALGIMKVEEIGDKVEVKKLFYPNPANRKLYDERFEVYRKIYEKNKPLWSRLNTFN